MKKKLPIGFDSWIDYHDFLKKNKPDIFKHEKIVHITYDGEYSISTTTLFKYCWSELQQYRLDDNSTHKCITVLASLYPIREQQEECIELLLKLNKKL